MANAETTDRAGAEAQAQARNRETPDGADHRWIVHQAQDGRWQVARIAATGMRFSAGDRPLRGERGPERDVPDDPRTTIQRLIPPSGPN